jgi:CDP-paratose 2-epimerase
MWWITDLTEFRNDYPDWNVAYDVDEILREIHAANVAQWTPA